MGEYMQKFIITWLIEALLVVVPIIVLFLVIIFGRDSTIERNILLFGFLLCIYFIFALIMFFYIPGKIMVFKPKINITPSSQMVLFEEIKKAFSQKNNENKNLFEVVAKDNKIFITWSNELSYNQVISYGANKWKKVFILDCDEKKYIINLSQKSIERNVGLGIGNFSFSGSYFRGLTVESEFILKPSFKIKEDGSILFNIEKLKYSSNEIMQPLLEVLLSKGWTVKGSIL
jgi:hypothetical protein